MACMFCFDRCGSCRPTAAQSCPRPWHADVEAGTPLNMHNPCFVTILRSGLALPQQPVRMCKVAAPPPHQRPRQVLLWTQRERSHPTAGTQGEIECSGANSGASCTPTNTHKDVLPVRDTLTTISRHPAQPPVGAAWRGAAVPARAQTWRATTAWTPARGPATAARRNPSRPHPLASVPTCCLCCLKPHCREGCAL
jgi:hypothetical protein